MTLVYYLTTSRLFGRCSRTISGGSGSGRCGEEGGEEHLAGGAAESREGDRGRFEHPLRAFGGLSAGWNLLTCIVRFPSCVAA